MLSLHGPVALEPTSFTTFNAGAFPKYEAPSVSGPVSLLSAVAVFVCVPATAVTGPTTQLVFSPTPSGEVQLQPSVLTSGSFTVMPVNATFPVFVTVIR